MRSHEERLFEGEEVVFIVLMIAGIVVLGSAAVAAVVM